MRRAARQVDDVSTAFRRSPGVESGNARGDRARALIADALIALVDEGNLRPTAAQIAARAGVSERSLYFHFGDAEGLFQAAAERRLEAIASTFVPIDPALPFDRRLATFVRQRAGLLEMITPMRRAALLSEHDSPAIAEGLARIRAFKAAQARAVFAPELALVPAADREIAAASVAMVSSFAAWESLRAHQGLAAPRAAAVMRALLVASLGRGPSADPAPIRVNGRRGSA